MNLFNILAFCGVEGVGSAALRAAFKSRRRTQREGWRGGGVRRRRASAPAAGLYLMNSVAGSPELV